MDLKIQMLTDCGHHIYNAGLQFVPNMLRSLSVIVGFFSFMRELHLATNKAKSTDTLCLHEIYTNQSKTEMSFTAESQTSTSSRCVQADTDGMSNTVLTILQGPWSLL